MDDTYLTAEEIADLLKVSVETIRTYLKAKKNPLPSYKVGRQYRILKSDFDEWMRKRKSGDEEK